MLVYSSNTEIVQFPDVHYPNDEKYYSFIYRPKARANLTEYLKDDVTIPSSANGFYYVCINPGISASVQPTMPTSDNATVTDGTVIWKAKAYSLMLNTGDVITTSDFSATTGVTLTDETIDSGITYCKVTDVGTLTEFLLSNIVTITRASGKTETFERGMMVTVGELG